MDEKRAVLETPAGPLGLEARGGELTGVRFARGERPAPPGGGVLAEAARQLDEYFRGRRREFRLPIRRPAGATEFQNRVWDALLRIPFGETRTYGQIAQELGTSPRAVGGACARNALPIVIPCHRVTARSGLGGFSGEWETGLALDVKKVLLDLEARVASEGVRG